MTITLQLPFAGFFESEWDRVIDREIEDLAEYLHENEPDFAAFELGDIHEALVRTYDAGATMQAIAHDYATAFADWLADELDVDYDMAFDGLTSPRFYNFETDRVFLRADHRLVYALLADTEVETLREVIRERHTSRDGFISHYSNDLDEWRERPPHEWDHNEVETVLRAWMRDQGHDTWDIEDSILGDLLCNGDISNAVTLDTDEALEILRENAEVAA